MYANNPKSCFLAESFSAQSQANVACFQAKTFSLAYSLPYKVSLPESFTANIPVSSIVNVYIANVEAGGGVSGELNIASGLPAITSVTSYRKRGVLNPASDISGVNTSGVDYFTIANLKLLAPIGATYGEQYWQDVPFDEIGEFMTDVYSIRYLTKNSVVDRKDVVRVLKSLSNLLRNCYEYDINEVFLGTIRIKKVKDSNYYVIVEY